MDEIELVIKISEKTVNDINDNAMFAKPIADHIKWDVTSAIVNGTILPKRHGRLIDADIIKDFKNKIKDYKKDYKFTQEEIFNILERYEIKYAPRIIEADKEDRK